MSKFQTELVSAWPPTADVAREAGHKPQSPLRAIREKCRDCSCYQLNEIRLCEAAKCPLWPFRAGKRALVQKPAGKSPGFPRGRGLPGRRALSMTGTGITAWPCPRAPPSQAQPEHPESNPHE
jgi:hypothetical protein